MARRTVHLGDELDGKLEARAAVEERSVSWCVQRAVEAWLGSVPGRPVTKDGAAPAAPRASVQAPPFARVKSLARDTVHPIGRKS